MPQNREQGDHPESVVLRGHPAVFDRKSSDLGGFMARIEPGYFKYRLDPDAHRLTANSVRAAEGLAPVPPCECGRCGQCQVRKQADQENRNA